MNEIQRIDDQLQKAFEGDPWYGPSLREVLSGVSAEQAAARPPFGSNGIWPIVLHIAAWDDVARRLLDGEVVAELPPEQNWPPVVKTGPDDWAQTLDDLERGHRRLREAI